LLDYPTDDEQVTLLTPADCCNIVRNMSLHDTRRTNFVLSEILIWTKYLQYGCMRWPTRLMKRRVRLKRI
jgi:hypothetical protein